MKKILLLTLLLPISFTYSQHSMTVSSNEVEQIYTEAIDAKFSGDLARSRFLLENLKQNNFTNEYVMTLLLEVYHEYLNDLILKREQKTFEISYPGIRENIVDVWNMYPRSETIHNGGLKIAMLVGDKDMGVSMAQDILSNNYDHVLANYLIAVATIINGDLHHASKHLKTAAYGEVTPEYQNYILQANCYLGDIYLQQRNYPEALKFYKRAAHFNNSLEIIAKIAGVEAFTLNIDESIEYFKGIPPAMMNNDLFHTLLATLWLSDDPNSRIMINTLLTSKQYKELDIVKALIQAQLGKTTHAIEILKNDTFTKQELPGLYYSIYSKLLDRLGQKNDRFEIDASLAKYYYSIKQYDLAKEHLLPLNRKFDTNGVIAYTLGAIARMEWDFVKAQGFFKEALRKNPSILHYSALIEVESTLHHFEEAQNLLNKMPDIEHWKSYLSALVLYDQNKTQESMEAVLKTKELNVLEPEFIYTFMAGIYLENNELEKAEVCITNLYQHDPYNNVNKNLLAYYYVVTSDEQSEENLDKALALSTSAVNDDPNNLAYLDTLAMVYTVREEYDKAQEVFTKILEKIQNITPNPSFEEIYAHLAYFYGKTGDKKLSDEYFKKSFDINSDSIHTKKLYDKIYMESSNKN